MQPGTLGALALGAALACVGCGSSSSPPPCGGDTPVQLTVKNWTPERPSATGRHRR